AVGLAVQLGVAALLFEAACDHPIGMRRHPRLEQRRVALLQRIGMLAAVAVLQQEALFLLAQQCQLRHIAVQALHQRQQQALEFAQQAFDGGAVEVALVERQVQAQVVAGVAHRREREQALQPLAHRTPLAGGRQGDTQCDAVDEQAHGVLHLRQADRAPGHGHAEHHVTLAAEAAEHQRPGRLGEGVD
uniref:Transcriptional regulator n=1 Tax=Steinernema glaseri TaxID=37863 RepID=A0A1I7XWQ1_9BILA